MADGASGTGGKEQGEIRPVIKMSELMRDANGINAEVQEKYKTAMKQWQEERQALINEFFTCPNCQGAAYQPTTHGESRKSTGGIIKNYTVRVIDGYTCCICSVRFGDPVTFTERREELAPILASHDQKMPQESEIRLTLNEALARMRRMTGGR